MIDASAAMTRWDTFRLVAECLRPALGPLRPSIPTAPIAWDQVVEASGEHLVAPTLGWCLRDDSRVPSDVFTCLDTLLELNGRRNALMLDALEQVIGSLNRVGITPVLLKGAAALVDGLFPDPGMRVVGDIDLLVPEAALLDGTAALKAAGFVRENPRVQFDADAHHLPARIHPATGISVELHKMPVPAPFRALVDAVRYHDDARVVRWRGLDARIPSPTDRVAHTVTHGQIVDEHYWRGIPRLRHLLELAALRTRHASEIAWSDLERRFGDAGFGAVLADTLAMSEELIERPGSRLGSPALRRLEATVNQPDRQRWTIYRRAVRRNARRVVQNPRFVLHALSSRFWRSEFKGIARRLQTTRW